MTEFDNVCGERFMPPGASVAGEALPERRCDPTCDGHAALCSLDGLGSDGRGNVVGVVLGLRLQGEQSLELLCHGDTVRSCLAKQRDRLIVILPCSALTETGAAYRVGRADARVDGEARGSDVAASLEVAGGCFGELRGLPRVGADLGC